MRPLQQAQLAPDRPRPHVNSKTDIGHALQTLQYPSVRRIGSTFRQRWFTPRNGGSPMVLLHPIRPRVLTLLGFVCALVMTLSSAYAQSDRKSTRLNSSHVAISYAVFCSQT